MMPRHALTAVAASLVLQLILAENKVQLFSNAVLYFNGNQLVSDITWTHKGAGFLYNPHLSAHPYKKLSE